MHLCESTKLPSSATAPMRSASPSVTRPAWHFSFTTVSWSSATCGRIGSGLMPGNSGYRLPVPLLAQDLPAQRVLAWEVGPHRGLIEDRGSVGVIEIVIREGASAFQKSSSRYEILRSDPTHRD